MSEPVTKSCTDCGTPTRDYDDATFTGDWLCYWCHCVREGQDTKVALNGFAERFKLKELVPVAEVNAVRQELATERENNRHFPMDMLRVMADFHEARIIGEGLQKRLDVAKAFLSQTAATLTPEDMPPSREVRQFAQDVLTLLEEPKEQEALPGPGALFVEAKPEDE